MGGANEQVCSMGYDANGCEIAPVCVSNNSPCPTPAPTCPPVTPFTCSNTETLCGGHADANNCPTQAICKPNPSGNCTALCDSPKTCGTDHINCPLGNDVNGCPQPDECVYNDPNATCSAFCPAHCSGNQETCSMSDPHSGCTLSQYCQDP